MSTPSNQRHLSGIPLPEDAVATELQWRRSMGKQYWTNRQVVGRRVPRAVRQSQKRALINSLMKASPRGLNSVCHPTLKLSPIVERLRKIGVPVRRSRWFISPGTWAERAAQSIKQNGNLRSREADRLRHSLDRDTDAQIGFVMR